MLCSGKQNPSLTLQVSGTVKGGLKDTMCHGSATKNTQAAGSEATPQLASCHLLILYTFHVSPELSYNVAGIISLVNNLI